MARKKIFKYERILSKIKTTDEGKRGTLRFQILGMPKEFNTGVMEIKQLKETATQIALDIKYLETVLPDPQTKTVKYPFTNWQIAQIEEHHKLRDDVKAAFTSGITFRTLYEEWFKTVKRSVLFNEVRFEQLTFKDKDMNMISAGEIIENLKIISKFTNYRDPTQLIGVRNRGLHESAIKSVFQLAEDRELLIYNPFQKSKGQLKKHLVPMQTRGKKFYWTFEQTELLFEAAKNYDASMRDGSVRQVLMANYELYLRMGIFTGARYQDLADLKWSDLKYLDTVRCEWSFKQAKHKSADDFNGKEGEKYRVTIEDFYREPRLLQLLQQSYLDRDADEERVFESRIQKDAICNSSINNHINKIAAIANAYVEERGLNSKSALSLDVDPIEDIKGSCHLMRHTMVAHIISGSGSWDAAKTRCGHSKVETTIKSYGDMMDVALEEALIRKQEFINKHTKLALQRIAPKLRVVK